MKKRVVVFFSLLLTMISLSFSMNVQAENMDDTMPNQVVTEDKKKEDTNVSINDKTPPASDTELYSRYKDNSFQLMTKEATSLTGLKASIQNLSGGLKEFIWAGIANTGRFNTAMVGMLFSFDLDTKIKQPILNITASMASGMLSIASSIGIIAVTLIMVFKYIAEQKVRSAFFVFLTTIGIFTTLVCFSSSTRNESISSYVVDIDNKVESTFVTVNPTFSEETKIDTTNKNSEQSLKSASDLIKAKVFRTSIYEPYLIFNYGTSNEKKIREKKVEISGSEYDRIGVLLDNDGDTKNNQEIHEKTVQYESDKLKNKVISYKNNFSLVGQGIFYLVLNIIQMVIYFVLCILRLILVLLRWLLFPLVPVVLLLGMFNTGINVFKNSAKGFITVIGLKAVVSFAMMFVASYMSFGYSMASEINNPYEKIITICIYLITPIGLYFFRSIIGKMLTGTLKASDLNAVVRHPIRTANRMNRASKEQAKLAKERRKDLKEQAKKRKKEEEERKEKDGKSGEDTKQPKSSESKFSNRRNEDRSSNPKSENAQEQNEKQPEQPKDIGAMRRTRKEKDPSIKEAQKQEKQEARRQRAEKRFSSLRREMPSKENQEGTTNNTILGQKFQKAHEESRYQDMKHKREQPERQRIKKHSKQRAERRIQEQQRLTSTGRSPRREGQSTQRPKGEVKQQTINTRPRTGKKFTPRSQQQPIIQPKAKWKKTGSNQVNTPVRKVPNRKNQGQEVPVKSQRQKSQSPKGRQSKRTVEMKKTLEVKQPKGVRRRRV
ncbi:MULTISPECIES: CD3337/EF1877 family mobilome membrane protein [Enterococcus]|uniref:CD3337/EF1877 family mobilome membrane protein n=1 Tax=Enterococcus TaxID=1350 RepID=UPI000A339C8F|nr:hypothetical protein [Enterococcus faecalis]EGO2704670.1 hypothetical protein [Enterococcus faecalis]OTP10692.1 hypothetical protein A5830_002757 [Enterococcus faecalis]